MSGGPSPVVLLDRDGVINVDLPTGVLRLADLRLEASAPAAIARFTAAGWRVAVCTNQACVGRGEVTAEELARIHAAIETAVTAAGGRIDAWFICTHRSEDRCACRKPEPGLLLQARDRFGFAPATTWFVGDAERDVEAAEAAGCRPLLVRTGKGRAASAACPDIPAVDDLAAAATLLLGPAR